MSRRAEGHGPRPARWVVLAAALAASLTGAPGVEAAASSTYAPPYAMGPQSAADPANVVQVDPSTGMMVLARANPAPSTFNCGGSGPYASFVVHHPVVTPVTTISVQFTRAAYDPYTWAEVVAIGSRSGRLGYTVLRGPTAGDGAVSLRKDHGLWQLPVAGETLTIDFGLTVSSACLPAQSADGGTATFASVTVSS